jgi:hypothetical protein
MKDEELLIGAGQYNFILDQVLKAVLYAGIGSILFAIIIELC